MSMRAVCLAITCVLGACTPATPAPENAPMIDESAAESAAETVAVKVIEPTPAMLKAALGNDPDAMRDAAVALAGCQESSTCPAEFGSCSSWSTGTDCDVSCFINACPCMPPWSEACQDVPPRNREIFWKNKFRVCFNASGQSCTEWSKYGTSVCGGC